MFKYFIVVKKLKYIELNHFLFYLSLKRQNLEEELSWSQLIQVFLLNLYEELNYGLFFLQVMFVYF